MNPISHPVRGVLHHSRALLPYIKRYRIFAAGAVGFVLLKEVAVLAEPTIFRGITDTFQQLGTNNITGSQANAQSLRLLLYFGGIQAGVLFASFFMLQMINRLELNVMRDAANDFMERVLQLSFRFHTGRKTGKTMKEFARGISGIEAFIDALVFNMIPLVMRMTVILSIFLWIDWVIGIVMLFMAITFTVFTTIIAWHLQRRREAANVADDEGYRKAADVLMNAEAVKYFQKEQAEISRYRHLREFWRKRKEGEWNGWSWFSSGQISINAFFITVIIGVMLWRLLHVGVDHNVTLPNFVMMISYIGLAVGMLWDFQHHIRRFQESITDLASFFRYFDEENDIVDVPNAPPLRVTTGAIRFEQVTFGYHSDHPILRDVSFTIPAGKSVAFVGPSGVGKSTIMKLLYRFYDPQSGRILIDGQDIRTVTQESVREALGIVPQEAALFNESIAYNIGYAVRGATQGDIERAARFAHIDRFIEQLPNGYNTLVGERGVKLSGGERQRLSLARAVLRNAPILVLDEATSSLDSATEAGIQKSLEELMHGRTSLIIAHRLSTIMHADFIVVMQDGRVEKIGTHEELLQHRGLYNRLWELQAKGYLD